MISGFQCECHGFMRGEVEGVELKSYLLFEAGSNRDGWFTNDDLVKQLGAVIPLFYKLHPNCEILCAFDNSMTHHKRAPDALDVHDQLPLKDNGKNAHVMRDTTFINTDGIEMVQRMRTAQGGQKGIKTILEERGLWDNRMRLECIACDMGLSAQERRELYTENGNLIFDETDIRFTDKCCARGCLRRQPDFMKQKEWLREVAESKGVNVIYYPKYHCEFNFIELTWGFMKSRLRRICTFSFTDLKDKVNNLLEVDGIEVSRVQSFARFCFRFMDGYRHGLSGPILDYTLKKCKTHRSIPPTLVDLVQGDGEESYKEYLKRKSMKKSRNST